MKLSKINPRMLDLPTLEVLAESFISNLYTISEDFDFFNHFMQGGGLGGRGRYANKPKRKGRSDFRDDATYEAYLKQYEKEMEEYHRQKEQNKSSGRSGGSSYGLASQQAEVPPHASALANVARAGMSALQSRVAPGVPKSYDPMIKLLNSSSDSRQVNAHIASAANIEQNVLDDQDFVNGLFRLIGIKDTNAQQKILDQTKQGATSTESAICLANQLLESLDNDLTDTALQLTLNEYDGILVSEAGLRNAFDAARRFVAQPRATAANAQASRFRSVNVSNAKLLAQNCLKYINQKLTANKVKMSQLVAMLKDSTTRDRAQEIINSI